MTTPNLFLIYVTDVERSTAFYSDLFDMQPKMTTPRYVPFELAPGVLFALWSGRAEQVTPELPRTCEVGLAEWSVKGVTVVEQPHDDVFGRTFVIADPDGNLIRVSPLD
jgi:predicted enzyme related to lactoylglutathione lyase